ncbi:MAG: imidazole glycerol phosphate synthase subunit HisH [Alphaproteobacteria bacterium]|nr:imidazole glycerol phosphate synthase subunit HisH [Alphaproteobacteria bacterium]
MKVAVIRTGVANLASVMAGLRRAGATPELTDDPAAVAAAPAAFLPGVGAFGAGMAGLRSAAIDRVLVDRIAAHRPVMAICLGLQMLARASEESAGVDGLGVFDATVTRFRGDVRIPQFGWNRVAPTADSALVQPGYAYFANAFKLDALPEGWAGAMGDHGGPFVAAVERGPVLACQFHPELSGDWGQALLRRWLEVSAC